MLVRRFRYKYERGNGDRCWTTESRTKQAGFFACSDSLSDLRQFAGIVRLAANSGKIARLGEMITDLKPKRNWNSCWVTAR